MLIILEDIMAELAILPNILEDIMLRLATSVLFSFTLTMKPKLVKILALSLTP